MSDLGGGLDGGAGGWDEAPPPPPPGPEVPAAGEGGIDDQKRSLIISALVKQVKDGSLSKRDLFNELSSLQQQTRRPSTSSPSSGSLLSSRKSSYVPETHSVEDRQPELDVGGFDDRGGGGHTDSFKRSNSDVMSLGSGASPPRKQEPHRRVSGFSNPDRRAFIQRLIEEKRRMRDGGEEVRVFDIPGLTTP
jgi:hypothetical protein